MAEYYDLDDHPTDLWTWAAIMEGRNRVRSNAFDGESDPADDPTRVGSDHIGEAWISTVWIGLNHAFMPDRPPLIYETMIFGGPYDTWRQRYSTRAQAIAGHDQIVATLREGGTLE